MLSERIGLLTVVARLGAALLLALPVAWQRRAGSHVGLRTVPLVSVGACGYLLLAEDIGGAEAKGRVIQGLLGGIGFIGGGAIVKHGGGVLGIATAATIWNMGAIGGAAAYGDYSLGVILSLINVLILIVGMLAQRAEPAPRDEDGD